MAQTKLTKEQQLVEDMKTIDRMPFQSLEEVANFAMDSLAKYRETDQQRTYRAYVEKRRAARDLRAFQISGL